MKNIVGYAYKLRGWVGSTDNEAKDFFTTQTVIFYSKKALRRGCIHNTPFSS
jgi:hypothetical protein